MIVVSKFYAWLGAQDLTDLAFRHNEFCETHKAIIRFDTFIYALFRGASLEDMISACVPIVDANKRKYSSKFEKVYPDIVDQIHAGNTKAVDVALQVGVTPRTMLAWIERGLIGGRMVEGGGLKGADVWHVRL